MFASVAGRDSHQSGGQKHKADANDAPQLTDVKAGECLLTSSSDEPKS